ncbi:Molybdopterin cofactor biosynthesis C domain-containing protein, partial [Calycina marina]
STSARAAAPKLTHLTSEGSAHMVDIAKKAITSRTAVAKCVIVFSNPETLALIKANQMKKGDVLGVARIAGIMAAKKTSGLIPLCHPIGITNASVELEIMEPKVTIERPEAVTEGTGDVEVEGSIDITASVSCDGKTGVEMEALTACSTAALTVYDMCKAVDKGMRIENLRVVKKSGGRSGNFEE